MISAVALASSLFWSAISNGAQAEALKLQTTVLEHQATVEFLAHYWEFAVRIEDARESDQLKLMRAEVYRLLVVMDSYIAYLDSASMDARSTRRYIDEALTALATAIPCEDPPEEVSEIWEKDELHSAAARAKELKLKTC